MVLNENGSWQSVERKKNEEPFRAQEVLYKEYKHRAEIADKTPKIEFEVRRKD